MMCFRHFSRFLILAFFICMIGARGFASTDWKIPMNLSDSQKENASLAKKFSFKKSIGFISAKDALNLYEGVWSGRQVIYVRSQKIGEARVQQRYAIDRLRKGALSGIAKMSLPNGRTISTRSRMWIENDILRLEVLGDDASVESYFGVCDSLSVTWVQFPMVKNIDVQIDSFDVVGNELFISSRGFKYVEIKESSFAGFILNFSDLKKESIESEKKPIVPNANKLFRNSRGLKLGR